MRTEFERVTLSKLESMRPRGKSFWLLELKLLAMRPPAADHSSLSDVIGASRYTARESKDVAKELARSMPSRSEVPKQIK